MDLNLQDDSLSYEHVFAASAETVYQHFTDISLASQWMAPYEVKVKNLSMDVRPGGEYRLEMVNNEGQSYIACGSYSEVVANKRLAYSWQWQSEGSPKTFVEIDFLEVDEGCLMKFRHFGFATSEASRMHSEGWGESLAKLVALFDSKI